MKVWIVLFLFSITLFASIGNISMLKGEATITRDGDVEKAKTGDDIEQGDLINTFNKSRMQVILNDDTIITLGANTEYIFNSYDSENDPHMNMTLNRGFLKTITGEIGKIAPERFKLKTKTSTIGIRGTGWITYARGNVENSLVFKGVISVKTPKGTFEVPAGDMLLMTDGVYKKYKADMNYFNSEIKRIEKRAKSRASNDMVIEEELLSLEQEQEQEEQEEEPGFQTPIMEEQDTDLSVPKAKNVLKRDKSLRISVVAQGVAPRYVSSPAQAYGMAKRAATVEAYRLIAERVNGVYVEGQDTIKNMIISRSTVRTQVSAMIKNADVVETRFKDGICEVEMEVVLNYDQFN